MPIPASAPYAGLGSACARALLSLTIGFNWATWAHASDSLELRTSERLVERITSTQGQALPSFLQATRVTGQTEAQTTLEGHATLRRAGLVISAEEMRYDQLTDTAQAQGQVRINRAGNVYEGRKLELRVDAFEGVFENPSYHFLRQDAHGQASRIDFLDDQRAVIHDATFTTCKRTPGDNWMPDWLLRATSLELDNAANEGIAKGVVLRFKGLPILPVPYLSFPLSDERKSGLLPPNIGLDNVNGFEFTQPYYWNIAPNRDATITPTVMTKRGMNLSTEFRYLEADYLGNARLNFMPSDQLRERNRWGLNLQHQGHLASNWTDHGMALSLNINRVSDNNYWRDFTTTSLGGTPLLTERLLNSNLNLAWSKNDFANTVLVQRWQTLQDVTAPIVPPYNRVPQLHTRYEQANWRGVDLSLDADLTRFVSNANLTRQTNGERLYALLQVSRPWLMPSGYITPKLQLHATSYQLDSPLANNALQVNRVLPTISIDSALVFERDAFWFGRAMQQTLEPRAFFVSTPYRNQQYLPNYDSGAYDFNMATIYTENAFAGNDRISDGSQLTLGVTSRFLEADTGTEALRLSLAQRLRFRNAQVTLPGTLPALSGLSDLLLGASVRANPRWRFDSTVQISPNTQQSVRSNLVARYNPGNFKTVSAAYRFQRGLSEQVDVGWQWPVANLWGSADQVGTRSGDGQWYSVGRLNYSMKDRQFVDTIVGFEYDAGCWLGRVVMQRSQTSSVTATQSIMFQLEFVGFTRLGVNPLQSLRSNIPNYQSLRAPTSTASRFSNYD